MIVTTTEKSLTAISITENKIVTLTEYERPIKRKKRGKGEDRRIDYHSGGWQEAIIATKLRAAFPLEKIENKRFAREIRIGRIVEEYATYSTPVNG